MTTLEYEMSSYGLVADTIISDGKIHRFKNHKDKNKNSWYVLHDHGDFQVGKFGCFKLDIDEKFCNLAKSKMSPEQKRAYAEQMTAQKRLGEQVKSEIQKEAMVIVNDRFNRADTSNLSQHPYLIEKDVESFGLRKSKDSLLVPMFNTDGELCNLQTINSIGVKRFSADGRVKGCFLMIGEVEELLILCEGYSTGASIYQATGIATAVCFNAGNLKEAGKELSIKHPDVTMLIAGDDDQYNEHNTGLSKAKDAAKYLGSTFVLPKFEDSELISQPTDFNDLHQLYGLDEVTKQIELAVQNTKKTYNLGSFIFYDSFFKATKGLSDEQVLEFYSSLCNYGLYRKELQLSPMVQCLFSMAKPQFDANYEKRKDGKKGGRPRKS